MVAPQNGDGLKPPRPKATAVNPKDLPEAQVALLNLTIGTFKALLLSAMSAGLSSKDAMMMIGAGIAAVLEQTDPNFLFLQLHDKTGGSLTVGAITEKEDCGDPNCAIHGKSSEEKTGSPPGQTGD